MVLRSDGTRTVTPTTRASELSSVVCCRPPFVSSVVRHHGAASPSSLNDATLDEVYYESRINQRAARTRCSQLAHFLKGPSGYPRD